MKETIKRKIVRLGDVKSMEHEIAIVYFRARTGLGGMIMKADWSHSHKIREGNLLSSDLPRNSKIVIICYIN